MVKCKDRPMHVVRVEGMGRCQLCTRHLASLDIQHLITIGVVKAERVEGLEGECSAMVGPREKVRLVGWEIAKEPENQENNGGKDKEKETAA